MQQRIYMELCSIAYYVKFSVDIKFRRNRQEVCNDDNISIKITQSQCWALFNVLSFMKRERRESWGGGVKDTTMLDGRVVIETNWRF
jgi:hypothetical protein